MEEYHPDPKGKMEKLTTVRSEILIPQTPQNVSETIMDFKQVYKFDEYLKSHDILEDHGDLGKVYTLVFKGVFGIISQRETVVYGTKHEFSNGMIIAPSISVTHPDCPQKKDPVRATIFKAGWVFVPVETNDGV